MKRQSNLDIEMMSNRKNPLIENDDLSCERSQKSSQIRKNKSIKIQAVDQQSQIEVGNIKAKKSKSGQQKPKKFSWSVWRKLFKYTLRRKFLALISLLLSIAFAMSVSLLPLKVGKVLDYITNTSQNESSKNVEDLNNGVRELGAMVFFLAIFTYLRYISMMFLQQFLAMDMREDFYTHFIRNDMYFFEQYKSGELVSRLSSDINQAKSAVSNNVAFLIRNLIIVFSNIIILFTISWELTFFVMLLVPVYSIATLQYSKRSKILVKQAQDVQAEVSATVAERFSGIQLVKAYASQQRQIENYMAIIMKGYKINRKKLLIQGIYNSVSEFLPYVGILITLWYGGSMVIDGGSELTAGQLTSFILYCSSLASSTSSISNSYTNIINGTYAVQKVFDMLDYQPMVKESEGEDKILGGQIQLRQVEFQYPKATSPILKNLNLKIKKGEYIAFVGESGSGKSTIIKLIEKFYKISKGDILFDSISIDNIRATSLRSQIGLVNQEATMFSGTITNNIIYGLADYSVIDLYSAAERAGCLEFLRNEKSFSKGFESQVGEKGNNLSGGQRQRISIARALMRKPKIIIFDQATSALDSNSEQMVQQSIQKLAQANNEDKPTIIVIAHRLSTVINADRIIVMKEGEIVEEGTHRQLRDKHGYYYQLIQKQLNDQTQ